MLAVYQSVYYMLAIFRYLFVVSWFARHDATKTIFRLRPAACR